MWNFWRSRERFSLDELNNLNDQLKRASVINESNKDLVIETLRSMAELLIWGDKHDPSFFEFFMEKQVMGQFIHILNISTTSSVIIQLLQTLNIMVQSMRSKQAIYYLFSNEYINKLLTFHFDFENEELVAYFISFLRTISTKLDKSTVSFFVKTNNNMVTEFPLYTEAINFAHHEENMVRIAVRTITLHIYNINDEAIQLFIMAPGQVEYFLDLVTSLRQQTSRLVDLVTETATNPESVQTTGRLEEVIAETGDLLFYCNDIINAGIPELSRLMTKHILELLVVPVLIPSLRPYQPLEFQTKELSSLYMLSCLFQVVKHKQLVNGIGLELLKETSCNEETITDVSQNMEEDQPMFESSRELLLSYLFCENDKLVLASLDVLVAMLQNNVLNETLLDALGILPQRKRQKKLLLQALVGNNIEEEVLFSSLPAGEGDDNVDLSSMAASSAKQHYCDSAVGNTAAQFSPRRNRYQVLDSLMRLLCRRPAPCAEALWHIGWLLRQLLPYHEQKLRDHHLRMLSKAYTAAQKDLITEIGDCWCDLLPSLLIDEWKMCKKASETSVLKKDTSFVLWPNSSLTSQNDCTSSAFVGERMQSSIKVFVILHQLRSLVIEGSIPDIPLLKQPKELVERLKTGRSGFHLTTVKRDTEIELIPGDAIPCKIAFEKGKERAVYLLVYSTGTSGWLLLAEDMPLKPRKAIIRLTAALAGSNPKVDEGHPKWLHLRIRSPYSPNTDVGKFGRVRSRSLVDGRWTLAFTDEKTAMYAQAVVLEEMDIQRSAVQQVLEPLLDLSGKSTYASHASLTEQ